MNQKKSTPPKIISEEYRDMLLKAYNENQTFLNKLILGISTIAIPLIFKEINAIKATENCWTIGFLICSLLFFMATIFLQIHSLKTARNGCDKSLSSNHDDFNTGCKLLMKAKKVDIWREYAFVAAIVFIFLSLIPILTIEKKQMVDKSKLTSQVRDGKVEGSVTPPTI